MFSMKSRLTLTAAAVALTLFVTGCAGNKPAADPGAKPAADSGAKYTVRLGTIQAPDNAVTLGAKKFAEVVQAKSNGRITVQVLPASQLGSAKEQIEGVKIGSQEAFTDATVWFGPYVPEYNILGMAFTFRDQDHVRKFLGGTEGQAMAEKLRTQHGVKVLTQTIDRVPRNLLTTKQVTKVSDLKGLKLRVPEIPSYVEAWKAAGVAPTPLAMGELYTALQGKVVEGLEVNTDSMYSGKFHEVAKHYASTAHVRDTVSLIINDKFYQSLPADLQKVLTEAAAEAEKYENGLISALEKESIDKMKAAGVTVNTIDVTDMKSAVKDVPAKLEAQNLWPKGLFEKIQAIK